MTPASYLHAFDVELRATPDDGDKINLLRRGMAMWTRKRNLLAKGKPQDYSLEEINHIISALDQRKRLLEFPHGSRSHKT